MSDDSKPGGDASPAHFASTAVAVGDDAPAGEVVRPREHPPGTRLGEFVIDRFIAEGGFGSVYGAHHPRFGQVALKISHLPATRLSTERLALQQDELEALLRLRHRSLVRVLDHGSMPDERTYLALELVEGESLHHYMRRRGRIDVLEAIALVRRLADGLAHCHEHNILHLDLTPRNVIVVDAHAPDLRIVDFGVAAFTHNRLDIQRRPTAGTPLYMAPELMSDTPDIGPHSDVYALGLIFFELLTANFPFTSSGPWEMFLEKLRGEAPLVTSFVPAVPDAVAATVAALLQPDPAKRGYSAASLDAHLKQLYFEILRGGSAVGRPAVAASGHVEPRTVPMIGRDEELGELVGRAAAALRPPEPGPDGDGDRDGDGESAAPAGWAVVITGDAGLGKSRLLAELSDRLHGAGLAMGYGRCREHGNLVSYASWRECLGQLRRTVARMPAAQGEAVQHAIAELLTDPAVADLAVLVPDLIPTVPDGSGTPISTPGEAGSQRVSQAVRRLVTTVCAHVPTALVLEDLHWADQGTLDILGELVSSPLPPGLVILGTARPEPELPPWPALDRVRLAPLDDDDSAALLGALAGATSPAVIAELTAAIPLLRLGNPLVDTQVILHLEREGLLTRDADGQVQLSDRFDRDYEPPTSVSSVLERRLRHVTPGTRAVLGIASLIGRQFHVADVRTVADPEIDATAVDTAVDEAVELSLCDFDGDECTFVHDVIRDHLVTTVPETRRPALHARIARTIAARGVPAATLAYHLDQAGDHAAAAARYVEGGIEADRVHDLIGSSGNLRRALDLYLGLPAAPQRDRALAHATHELVRITCLLGKTDEPLDDLDRCQQALTDPPADAQAMLDSAYARVYYAQGVFDKAMAHSERCLAVDDPSLGPYQCVPANMLGRALCASGHFGASIDVLVRGCQLLRDASDQVELAHSSGLLGTSLAFVGRFDESHQCIDDSDRIARAMDSPARRMGVCLYRTLHAEAAGRWADGVAAAAQLLSHAETYSMAGLYLYLGTMMAGRHHFHVGELHRARHLLKNAINFSNIFGIRTCKSWAYAHLADVFFVEGQLADAEHWYGEALDLARVGRGDGYGIPLALIGQAHLAAYRDQPVERVVDLADQACASFEAASNLTGLATGLDRYLDALTRYPDQGQRRAAAEARLTEVLDRIGPPRREFWPRIPTSAAPDHRALPAHDYWRQRSKSGITVENLRVERPDERSLLLSLSTVEDYVPDFVARQIP